MESETMILQSVTIPPVLPPKTKLRTVISHQMNSSETGIFESEALRYPSADSARPDSGTTQSSTVASSSQSGSASSLVGFSSRSSQSTVFLAANADQYGSTPASVHQPPRNGHVVTIRINPTDNNPQQHNNNTQPKQQPLIVNASMDGVTTFKGNTKVSLNQTSPINTIGKFIVNICENGDRNNRVIEETSSYSINNNDSTAPLNGCVRISVGATETINSKDETDSMVQKTEGLIKPSSNGDMGSPYFFCNPFPCSPTNLMSSGQCSPSDTLDSGTCSDLDGTPPPLPKKKLSKSNGTGHKRVSVTVIGATTHDRAPSVTSSGAEVDSEDSESNISCDSLNSSELSSASLHEDSTAVTFKSEILKSASLLSPTVKPPVVVDGMPCAPKMPTFLNTANTSSGFLPQGLLQDIRDRSAKLSTVIIPQEEQVKTSWSEIEKRVELTPVKKEVAIKPEEKLTSFKLVSQINTVNRKIKTNDVSSMPPVIIDTIPAFPKIVDTTPAYTKVISIVNESTYVDRKLQEEKQKKDQLYSGNFLYDTDKYYNFHLNENVFDNETSENDKKGKKKNGVSVNGKSVCSSSSDSEYMDEESMEYFAGYKDYKNEDGPAAIRSAKGTIRGVKNRVRAGIATFLQMQNTSTKSYKEKDAGKIVFYTTSMGIVRDTYQKCVLVKKILRNLLVKFEERDVFMSMEYQEEIKDRMHSSDVMVPQLFVDGQHIGGAETVEILNEAGELRRMLKPYKSADACTTCQMCGGYRLLPCQVCSGSKKSVHRNHFTAEFVALKCMNCDEVGLVKCEAC